MAKVDLLAPSRAGDKFHYYWAARKTLELLRPGTTRTEIVVEGRSPSDRETDADEVIDVAEYFTSEAPQRVIYSQLKHSTRRLTTEWTISDFEDVISRFATVCQDLLDTGSISMDQMRFRIVTNRPIASSARDAVQRVAASEPANPSSRALQTYVAHLGAKASAFLERLEFDDTEVGVLEQVDALERDSGSYLVAANSDLMLRLKEVVADRASTDAHPPIRRADVLLALKVDEGDLLPVPSAFDSKGLIKRAAYKELRERIIDAPGATIVHAAGGVGKSSFSAWLAASKHQEDEVVVFDCFAGGSYREVSQLRHDHRRGLTQIANELATRNLCEPLVPTTAADSTQYMRAFLVRVREAAAALDFRGKRLIIVVDAADNSVMAAEAQIGSASFAPDLLRETMPDNVRIVLTARTERVESLSAPPQTRSLSLAPFTVAESEELLAQKFAEVTTVQAAEFREATWGNARVQAFAIGAGTSVAHVLKNLAGFRLTSAIEALDELIRSTLANVRDSYGRRANQIDMICAVLASLRPVIRIKTVAEIAGVPTALVESFLTELPFSVQRVGETLHFRDEPTETYFRRHLMPDADALDQIIAKVERLASDNFYLASALPQLLWESNRYSSLIGLALADRALPSTSATEAREVAKHRMVYALRAAIALREWGNASRLSLRAGRLSAAGTVRDKVISENCDLAGFALDLEMADRYVASRALAVGDPGFNLAREGLLLAMRPDSQGVALGRMRSACEWMSSYSRQPDMRNDQPRIGMSDIADVLLARLIVQGPAGLEEELGRFRDWVHFPSMRIVASRFLDQGDPTVLDQFLQSTSHRLAALACCKEMWICDLSLSGASARHIAAILKRSRAPFPIEDHDDEDAALGAVLAAVVLAIEKQEISEEVALRLLSRHLPDQTPKYLGNAHHRDRLTYALGSALAAALVGSALDTDSLASDAVKKKLSIESTSDQETREYRSNIIPTIPWLNAWANSVLGKPIDLAALRTSLKRKLAGHEPPRLHAKWLLRTQTSLSARGRLAATSVGQWLGANGVIIGDPALIRAARSLRYQSPKRRAIAEQLVSIIETRSRSYVEGAAAKTALYVDLARICWTLEPDNARAYFLEALDAADLIGDEIHLQWQVTSEIAVLAAPARPTVAQAVAFARASEGIQRADLLELSPVESVRIIAAMNPVVAVDVASRWRDRRIATLEQSLDGLLGRDDGALRPHPGIAISIAALHREPVGRLLTKVSSDQAKSAFLYAVSVLHRRGVAPDSDQELCMFARTLGHDLQFRPSNGHRAYSNPQYSETKREKRARKKRAQRIRQELAKLNYRDAASWRHAIGLSTWKNGLDRTEVFPIALPPIASNDRSAAIRALVEVVDDSGLARSAIKTLHSLENVSVPERRATIDTVQQLVTRFSHDVATSTYQALPLSEAAQLLGRSVSSVREGILEAWAQSEEPTSVDGYYAMTIHLAKLAGSQATLTLLNDALEQFDTVVEATTIELPPVDVSAMASSIASAIARLVWGALADPATATRWDAAFSVIGLIRLSQSDVLNELSALAQVGGPEDSGDPAFEFYSLHADWFLLLALRRAVIDTDLREGVRRFEPFLKRVTGGPVHAILSPLAQEIVAVLNGEELPMWPPVTPVRAEWNHRGRDHYNRPDVDYKFDWDFRESQIHDVADAFGLDREQVERDVSDLITQTWRREERGSLDEDVRHTMKVFQEGETYDRYANPPVHDLDHYLSLHALMSVAGSIAETYPAQQHEGSDEDEFTRWLREHRIVRADGYWVSETRMAPPVPPLEENGSDELWDRSIRGGDFMPHLHISSERFVCWADYDSSDYTRSESVKVQTVLVPAELASAYVRALQLDRDFWDFRVPTVQECHEDDDGDPFDGGDKQSQAAPYVLRPWVRLIDGREGLDKHDHAVGNLRYPPPHLDAEFLGVIKDSRPPRVTWRDGDNSPVAWAEAWDDHGYQNRGRSGSRLVATYDHLDVLLATQRLALVAVVSIDRRLNDQWRRELREDRLDSHEHNFRVFEYRSGRGWVDYQGRPQAG